MNAIIVYEIYTITDEENLPDLTIGLARYHEKHPGLVGHDMDKQIRQFIGRHGQELAKAYPDPVAFTAAVADCEAKDKEAAEKAEE